MGLFLFGFGGGKKEKQEKKYHISQILQIKEWQVVSLGSFFVFKI